MTQYNNVYRALYGEIMGETDKAIKFEYCVSDADSVGPEFKTDWFPRSQISSIHRLSSKDNDECDIIMVSEWLLKQKGILHLASTEKPKLNVTTVSDLSSKLTTPPAPSFADMDDDIPF